MGDYDGDGDLDLICGNLYFNDGKGVLFDTGVRRLPASCTDGVDFEHGDVDGDGDMDIVCGRNGMNRLFLNDGRGLFSDGTAPGLVNCLGDTNPQFSPRN